MRSRSGSVNANEIANGILSALVGITAGCAFVDYWAACLIGSQLPLQSGQSYPSLVSHCPFSLPPSPIALPSLLPSSPPPPHSVFSVILYHVGCYAEYKLNLKDTAHVVPVHGVCGLWSIVAIGVFQVGAPARCNLHAAFEGLCYCHLRLPALVCVCVCVCVCVQFIIVPGSVPTHPPPPPPPPPPPESRRGTGLSVIRCSDHDRNISCGMFIALWHSLHSTHAAICMGS